MLVRFLYDLIATSQDCQVRVRWTEGTEIILDVSEMLVNADRHRC